MGKGRRARINKKIVDLRKIKTTKTRALRRKTNGKNSSANKKRKKTSVKNIEKNSEGTGLNDRNITEINREDIEIKEAIT